MHAVGNKMCTHVWRCMYSVSQKSSPPPKTLCSITSPGEPVQLKITLVIDSHCISGTHLQATPYAGKVTAALAKSNSSNGFMTNIMCGLTVVMRISSKPCWTFEPLPFTLYL